MDHPLTHGQRALWFLQQVAPESGAYNLVHAVRFPPEHDVLALQRALQGLVDRHPVLRTTFAAPDGEPVQRIHDHMKLWFVQEDASSWSEAYLQDRLADEVYRPFDLVNGPLMRVTAFSLATGEYITVLAIHHMVTDLWSLTIFMYELGILYTAEVTGEPASLKPLRAPYTDHVRAQNEMLSGPDGERLWAYWQRRLAGSLPVLDLPTDRPRPPMQTYRGTTRGLVIDPTLAQGVKALAKACGTSPFVTCLTAFQVLLHHYSGQDDILVGSMKASRSRRYARTMGYFVNPVALRADLSGDPTFCELLARTHETVLGDLDHGDYPFALLIERLQPARDLSRSPIFQVMFTWQKTTRLLSSQNITSLALSEERNQIVLGELAMESMALDDCAVPFDLVLLMAEAGEALSAAVEFNTDLFEATTITRMLEQFRTLLASIVADPDRPISELSLLSEDERQQILAWSRSPAAPEGRELIPGLFEAQAARTPDAPALVLGSERLTYGQLNRRANQLAHRLQRAGAGPETVVGLLVERSLDALIGLLAILKAGGVYLPLDPANPPERLAYMLQDARVPILLTQERLQPRLPDVPVREIIRLDADWGPSIAQESDEDPVNGAQAENAAYVIYTSGSTGEPKGVVISNGEFADHCWAIREHFELTASDRVLQFASYSFDQSLEQILATLVTGATLVLRGPEVWPAADFTNVVAQSGLTVVNLPPAYWHQWVQAWDQGTLDPADSQLRLVISGGDVMLAESLRFWRPTPMNSARLLNAYGPTETTITALTYAVPPKFERDGMLSRIPIGRPVANRRVHILNAHGQPVPIGVPGELYLGGAGLARGYLNQPGLTAGRFVPDPFSQEPGARLYRTGDLVRFLPDGSVEFLGRVDQQVKVRGFRIELGEIEAVLDRHPGVQEAAVLMRELGPGDKRLVAYWVARHDPVPTTTELRNVLTQSLPEYMAPSAFVRLDVLPLSASGKIDRQELAALPLPDLVRPDLEQAYVAPRNPIEADLAQMWSELLGIERVGIHDSFFDLGGHSLIATQLVARVREAYRVELPLANVFETPTVAALATALAQSLADQEEEMELAQLLAELEELTPEEAELLLADEGSHEPA